MKATRKHFIGKLQIIKVVAKGLENAKFYAIVLVLVILAGILSFSLVVSSFRNSIVITSTGEISTGAYARSGSAEDIQAAVDWVAGSGDGIGNVYIPEGTYNFVEVGEPWMTVNIPPGVNLFGAPTERTSGYPEPSRGMSPNDQVVEWKTVLVMPYDVPGDWDTLESTRQPSWFVLEGDDVHSFRFSDIKLVGYRSINSSSNTLHYGVRITDVPDFRVDHCWFEHVCVSPIRVVGEFCHGVIDHCCLFNNYTDCTSAYREGNVGYGVEIHRTGGTDLWESDTLKVVGQYTNYSTYIEDCYLSKFRHCVCSLDGAHYVFRHNTIKGDHGFGSIDAHGTFGKVGTRAIEVYSNEFLDCLEEWTNNAVNHRGGAGVYFNNYATPYDGEKGYTTLSHLINEGSVPKCWPHDVYFWNNSGQTAVSSSGPVEGEDYFLNTEMPGYTPYTYPHPLTLEAAS